MALEEIVWVGFAVLAAMILVVGIRDIFARRKVNKLERAIEQVRAKMVFIEGKSDVLEENDYGHDYKIRGLYEIRDDITNRVREIEKSLYEVQDDSK